MQFGIAGRTALVTGANRGIGEAIVDSLLAHGAVKVYATARTLGDLAPLVARHGSRVVPLRLDVTDAAQIADAATTAHDVEMLFNNAGIVAQMHGTFTDPRWPVSGREEMNVNYFGTLAVTQAFAPVLAANGGGAVINIGSLAGLVNFAMVATYSASKAALHSLTQATRALLGAQGTLVYGVYPGPIDTRMSADLTWDKASPAHAAEAIVRGIEAGEEDIFPDPMSAGMGTSYLADPKELERQVAAMSAA